MQRCIPGVRLQFTRPLTDQTLKEGATAMFELELSHDDVPVVWYRNEVKVHVSRTVVTRVEGRRHLLELRSLSMDDTCQIKAEARGVSCVAKLSVTEGDAVFITKLSDFTAVEKDEVSLQCELSKDVPVMWFRDQVELTQSKTLVLKTEGTKRTLLLKKVEMQDQGQYCCDCGTDQTKAKLTVEARDIKVVRPIYGVELFDGETARFEAEISADDVHGQWRLNGEVLSPSSDVDIIEEGSKHTLILYNCKVSMAGEVSFSAANAKCAANLKVKELPLNFLTPLSDVQVYEKDEARFEVEVSRVPKTFRWLKGSAEVQSDDKFDILQEGNLFVLRVKSAAYEDEAKYMFEAEDKRTAAKLVIQGIRLEFVKPIKDVTVKERETAEFSVELSHDKIPVVWYKNDVRLHPSKVVHMSDQGKVHSLSIKEATIDDTSMIRVEAMDKSLTAMLTVIEGDLYFTQKLQNYTAVERDEVQLVCELSKATADVKWFKDGKEITPSKNIAISSDGKKRILTVRKAEKTNIGAYTCDCGSDKTTANLNIEERDIKVVRPLYSVEVTETETAKFETEISEEDVHGNWKLKGEALHQSADVEMKEEGKRHLLILYNVKLDMAGAVDFSAANAKSNAQLRVKEAAAEFTQPLEDQSVEEEATAVLECQVSRENAEVRWFREGQEIRKTKKYDVVSEGRRRALVIQACSPDDAKLYTCDAQQFKTSCFLEVLPPHVEFTKPLHDVEVREKESAKFECEVSRESAKVRWFRDGNEIRKSKKYEILSKGVQRILIVHKSVFDDEAEYECDARTAKSSGMLTVTVSKPSAEVRWFKQDQEIPEGGRYEHVSDGRKRVLIIQDLRLDDRGITAAACSPSVTTEAKLSINGKETRRPSSRDGKTCRLIVKTCRPTNECEYACGVDERRTRARLFVEGKKPRWRIVRPPQDLFEPPGSDVVFEAELNKTVRQIPDDQRRQVHRLQVCEIRPRDQGEYRIVAKDRTPDQAGARRCSKIKTTDQTLVTDAGKPFVMSVRTMLILAPTPSVLRPNVSPVQNIDTNLDKTEYRLKSPTKEDQGRYRVHIKNKHGEAEAHIQLDVIDVPGPVKSLQVVDTAEGEVSLSWEEPESDGGAKITSYVVERRTLRGKRGPWPRTAPTRLNTACPDQPRPACTCSESAPGTGSGPDPACPGRARAAQEQVERSRLHSEPFRGHGLLGASAVGRRVGGHGVRGGAARPHLGEVGGGSGHRGDGPFRHLNDVVENKEYIFRTRNRTHNHTHTYNQTHNSTRPTCTHNYIHNHKTIRTNQTSNTDINPVKIMDPIATTTTTPAPTPTTIPTTTTHLHPHPQPYPQLQPHLHPHHNHTKLQHTCTHTHNHTHNYNHLHHPQPYPQVQPHLHPHPQPYPQLQPHLHPDPQPPQLTHLHHTTTIPQVNHTAPPQPHLHPHHHTTNKTCTHTHNIPHYNHTCTTCNHNQPTCNQPDHRADPGPWSKRGPAPLTLTFSLEKKTRLNLGDISFPLCPVKLQSFVSSSSEAQVEVSPVSSAEPPFRRPDSFRVTLTWETPASNGGSLITGYIIEKCDDGIYNWLRVNAKLCPDLSYRVTGLKPQQKFFFRVRAENAAGVSEPSDQVGPCWPTTHTVRQENVRTLGLWSKVPDLGLVQSSVKVQTLIQIQSSFSLRKCPPQRAPSRDLSTFRMMIFLETL
ncbi:hypothetical protein WMY93_002280 [Mugilogobius chulae]|uniref:non-specific serine/threonine protein kinase n=1 Tax=Mugilogobius chulae TaxID=88201 RepID=A0AAW0Q4B4_9GOBI